MLWTLEPNQETLRRKTLYGDQIRPFKDVTAIHARQVDMLTYPENFLVFYFRDGSIVSVGETDCGVDAMELALRWFGIEGNWYAQLETGGPGTELVLFRCTRSP